MSRWVTVITFVTPYDSYVAQSLLESAGIPVFLRDENTIHVINIYSQGVGGVRLQVPEEYAQEALDLLTEGGFIESHAEASAKVKAESRPERFPAANGERCPYCGSDNVGLNRSPRWGTALAYLGFPPLIKVCDRKRYHCFDCRKEWKTR